MARDYVSDNLSAPHLDRLFPQMIEADKSLSTWPWFRKSIDHVWRVDRRHTDIGFINRDETAILYSNARAFAGRKAIEIGAFRGWSTAHLITAEFALLHVVEPLLEDPEWRREFQQMIEAAGGAERTLLVPQRSPEAVRRLGEEGARWSFAFIDGDHDGEAPTNDALAVEPWLEADAMVIFHDLVSPYVAAGLLALGAQGWNIAAYQTMQMMGVAWRGAVTPAPHTPDPEQVWDIPVHLAGVRIIGAP